MSDHDDIPDSVQGHGKDSLPSGGKSPDSRNAITKNRIIIWVLVGGFALYMIGTGVVGILTK